MRGVGGSPLTESLPENHARVNLFYDFFLKFGASSFFLDFFRPPGQFFFEKIVDGSN